MDALPAMPASFERRQARLARRRLFFRPLLLPLRHIRRFAIRLRRLLVCLLPPIPFAQFSLRRL
jgi:hypothetical protein